MATHINDLAASTLILPLVPPQEFTADATGPAADLAAGDGPCTAVQLTDGLTGGATLAGRIEESNDLQTWTAVDPAFTPATGTGTQVIRFTRAKRYVRWAADLTGDDDPTGRCAAVVIQPRKTF